MTEPTNVSGAEVHSARRFVRAAEELLPILALAAMVVLPLAEIVIRPFISSGIPGSIPFVQHLTLWVGFLGAAIAARDGKLIALATATFIPEGPARHAAHVSSAFVGSAVSTVLAAAAVELVRLELDSGTEVAAGVKVWVAQLVLPIGFAAIALRLVWGAAGPTTAAALAWRWIARLLAAPGLVVGYWLSRTYLDVLATGPIWPWIVVVLASAVIGAPIFTILGGAAVLLFMSEGVPPATVMVDAYALATQPHLPSLPLFTLTGFLLAEGHAPERLLRVFRAFFGWIPGGTAVVCALLCAFFTIFTGGSGVTILALGGLLFPALVKDGYRERFALGLLTASGSLGLLWAPALPLILYAIVAEIPPEHLFAGGILPGVLLAGLVASWGVREGIRTSAGRHAFTWPEARAAAWEAKWELLLPVVVLGALFGGFATLVETAALSALYALIIQALINKDLALVGGVRHAVTECVVLIGGVLVILAVAVGFTSYLIDAEVPARLLELTQTYVQSPLVFLLGLNVFLLIVGCLMDIFSAIVVVVPLLVPAGQAYGLDPVHLGIIFIANLELGYLTPPVGLNLYLSSYRFKRPMMEVTRAAIPLLLIMGFGVLVITYVPWLTTGLLDWWGRS